LATRKNSKKKAPEKTEDFRKELWKTADILRGTMDPGEYKHIVLGLICIKFISDSFMERYNTLKAELTTPGSEGYLEPDGLDEAEYEAELRDILEDKDEYTRVQTFWVPEEARWDYINARANLPEIGQVIDHAMKAIEEANLTRLKGVLPKVYNLPTTDGRALGKLVALISNIETLDPKQKGKDVLGDVYEYFLSEFANAEGKRGGTFYTPESVVRTLVELIEPLKGRIYDPCCGSGGMFVQSVDFIESHQGNRKDASIYGQESNPTTLRLSKMNLMIHQITANFGEKHADTFHNNLHKGETFDYILANPPFNISEWDGAKLRDDIRWKGYTTPPPGNANYAWILHIIHHLAPHGTAAVVMANGSMSSMTNGEGDIRQKLVENDLVDCMVALPGQLFTGTQIPVCVWVLAKDKTNGSFRNRSGQVLFIDARKLGFLKTRVLREFTKEDIEKIAGTYHAWRNKEDKYEDEAGFCKSASLEEIQKHDFVLTPGRYVGAAEVEDDGEPFEEKMDRLTTLLREQMAASKKLDRQIEDALEGVGYGL
jgi:type I restriction enzyme M protein